VVELVAARLRRELAESIERKLKRLGLASRNAGVVDQVVLPQRGDGRCKIRQRGAGIFRDGFDVDIERVEKEPAAWKIGTCFLGPVIEQRMQRIETNRRSAELGRDLDQVGKIGEV